MRPYGLQNFLARGQDAQKRCRTRVNDRCAVDEHLEFPIATFNHIYIGRKLTTKLRRHTDGVQAGYSICAITNRDSRHVQPRNFRFQPTALLGLRWRCWS